MKISKISYLQMLSFLSLFINSLFSIASAETATTTQDLNLTIPLVVLLDVQEVNPNFTFSAPNNAGEGLSMSSSNTHASVAATSNSPSTKLLAHVNTNLIPHGLGIKLDVTGLGSCRSVILSTSDQTICNVGNIQTNSAELSVDLDTTLGNGMASYGSYVVEILYTLTEN